MTRTAYVIVGTGTDRTKPTALRPVLGGADVPLVSTPPPPAPGVIPGMTKVYEEQFATLDPTRFKVYDNSNFGAPTRIQLYKAANITVGAGATAGATNGTSLRMYAKRETVVYNSATYNFTSGMLDTKSVGAYYPRYGWFEFRCKTPHGQGIWPSIWMTAMNGGANTAEMDIMEYFHVDAPGRNRVSLHAFNGTGTHIQNKYSNGKTKTESFFEHPTYTPGWHTFATEIVPVTSAAGTTLADPTLPSTYVRITTTTDGANPYRFVDTTANLWTAQGGDADQFWQFYLQGSQAGGSYVGYPDDPLGWESDPGMCPLGGSGPNACNITANGVDFVQRAQYGDPSSTLEVDYLRVYKYTG